MFIVQAHRKNNPQVDKSIQSDTLSRHHTHQSTSNTVNQIYSISKVQSIFDSVVL